MTQGVGIKRRKIDSETMAAVLEVGSKAKVLLRKSAASTFSARPFVFWAG